MPAAKQTILRLLEQSRGVSLSGEQIAQELNISRAAVWKAVNQLKKEGYRIEAVQNRGYRLDPDSDLLSAEGIRSRLPFNLPLFLEQSLPSTNQAAKKLAIEGAAHGTTVLASGQTAGRGRLGRTFFSPVGAGLYMSVLLRPEIGSADAVLVTIAAAVAVCLAVEETTGIQLGIKWVNDLLLGKKKVGGILTEGITAFESGAVEAVVVGVGLNLTDAPFPPELDGIACSLFGSGRPCATRNELAAAILRHLFFFAEDFPARLYLDEYRRRSTALGRQIEICGQGVPPRTARAVSVADDGGLTVRYPDGREETLRWGEISIRPLA